MWEFHGIMLTAEELVRRRTKLDFNLPIKGPKCFTPSSSWLETKQLQTLLDATKTLIAEERVERENALAQAEWDENLKVARVTRIVGRQFEKFGHEENMTIFLYPEEALYLLETNHLQLLFGGVSMSIQQAYTVLLGTKTGCSFVEYIVFSHLLKNGFKVLRHSAKRTVTRYERLIGLHVEQPRNRKSRRKYVVSEKENSGESNNIQIKKDIQTKNEKQDRRNKVDLCLLPNKLKQKSADKVCGVPSIETTTDNNSSVGSDIEILSEKNAFRSEESLDYTEYSSSSSEDSDCQVIEEINTEINGPATNIKKFCYDNKVIEEINLSDSEGSNVACCNIEGSSIIKNEITCEVELCNVTEMKESASQDEQGISNGSCDSEKNVSRNSNVVECFVSEVNDGGNSCDVVQMNSNQLMQSVCVAVDQTVAGKDIVVATVGKTKQLPEYENYEDMSGNISVLSEVKKESSLSAPLPRESVIQMNTAVSCKKEINDTIVLESHHNMEDIEVIDLGDENTESDIFEDRKTILLSFPNVAGCHIIRCNVPPQRLCPPNVCPSQQTYNIDLERLQDPRYGGNPRKKRNIEMLQRDERYQHQYARHESASQTEIFRYSTHSNRHCNRYNNDNNNSFSDERNERWHYLQNQSRGEGFVDYSGFSNQPMYPNFQSAHMDKSDQTSYPHFSGQPSRNLAPYQNYRVNFRSRGNSSRDMFQQNSPFRNGRFRSSRVHRFSRRRGRGGRNTHGARYFGPRDREHNESFDKADGNYVPFNVETAHSSYVQSRRSQLNTLGEKRHGMLNEENINSSCSREKRPRSMRGNYFPPTRNSHNLLQFLDIIHPDSADSAVANSEPVVSSSNCDNNLSGFHGVGQNASAFAETESTDNSSSRRSSCSDSCSSEGSSEESVDESYKNEAADSVSVLLKSENLEDIDSCLKSLEIVRSVQFKGLPADSGESLLSIKFDLYQPSTPFRRSNPPVPDFRVVVTHPDQNLPTSRQLAFLGDGFEDDVPLLFAVASTDSVSFYLQSVVNLPTVSCKEKIQG